MRNTPPAPNMPDPQRTATRHHAMAEDERTKMQIEHSNQLHRMWWSRFLSGVATGVSVAWLLIWLAGCGSAPARASADAYTGRDRFGPSPAQELAESPYGEGFNPRQRSE